MKSDTVTSLLNEVEKEEREKKSNLNSIENKVNILNRLKFEETNDYKFGAYMLGMFVVGCTCFVLPKLPVGAAVATIIAANACCASLPFICYEKIKKNFKETKSDKENLRSRLEQEKKLQDLKSKITELEARNNILLDEDYVVLNEKLDFSDKKENEKFEEHINSLVKSNYDRLDEINTKIALKKTLYDCGVMPTKFTDILTAVLESGLIGIQFYIPMSILSRTPVSLAAFVYPAILAGCTLGTHIVKYGDEKRKILDKYSKTFSTVDDLEVPELEDSQKALARRIGSQKAGLDIRKAIISERYHDNDSNNIIQSETQELENQDEPYFMQVLDEVKEESDQEKVKTLSRRK